MGQTAALIRLSVVAFVSMPCVCVNAPFFSIVNLSTLWLQGLQTLQIFAVHKPYGVIWAMPCGVVLGLLFSIFISESRGVALPNITAISNGFLSTPSPFSPPVPTRPSSRPVAYASLDDGHHHDSMADQGKASDTLSADAERKLGAFFKLAHSRILTDGRASDIRALAAGLFPAYLQLCAQLGDEIEGGCDIVVRDLFKARYNEVQIELDRMDRLQLVLVRLMRARGRWGKKRWPVVDGSRALNRLVWRRVRKGGRWVLGDGDEEER